MAEGRLPGGTLGEVLATRRRRRFVGRSGELELVRTALAATEPPFSVLWLTGPGGIGKTSLLDAIAELAQEAGGSSVVRLDGRDLPSSPGALLHVVQAALDEPVAAPEGRLVLLLDAYERLGALDDWVRRSLLPGLPATALTVVASREPPTPAWRADPAWRELLRVVALRNLDPDESRDYLRACGVEEAVHDRLLEVTRGHPLGLSLLADVVVRGGDSPPDPLTPDLVGVLVQRFVDVVPVGPRRSALEVCALARVTTEALLRDTLALQDAHEWFGWLRDLSFIEAGPDGLLPHDLARDVLDADLRWRDPDGYKQRFRAVRGHIYAGLRSSRGREQQRSIFDLKFLFRNLPGILSPVDWDVWGLHYPERANPADAARILALVAAQMDLSGCAQRSEELADVADQLVRGVARREVAAAVVVAPMDDVGVVAIGEPADRLEVVGEDRDAGRRRGRRRSAWSRGPRRGSSGSTSRSSRSASTSTRR